MINSLKYVDPLIEINKKKSKEDNNNYLGFMGNFHFKSFRFKKPKPWVSIHLLVAVLFLSAGCTMLGPDFETPESEVEEEWIDIENPTLKRTSDEFA